MPGTRTREAEPQTLQLFGADVQLQFLTLLLGQEQSLPATEVGGNRAGSWCPGRTPDPVTIEGVLLLECAVWGTLCLLQTLQQFYGLPQSHREESKLYLQAFSGYVHGDLSGSCLTETQF